MFLNLKKSTSSQPYYNGFMLTVANNAASSSGTGANIYVGSQAGAPQLSLKQSIVAGGTQGGNCGGQPLASAGFNLEDQNSCGLTAPGDLVNRSPSLGALQFDRSLTEVHPLPRTSPAVDVIPVDTCAVRDDQRHILRPQDGNRDGIARCDVGAYELTIQ